MCFELISVVDYVEEADIVEFIDMPKDGYGRADLFIKRKKENILQNALVDKILEYMQTFGVNPSEQSYRDGLPPLADRTVAIPQFEDAGWVHRNGVHSDLIYPISDPRLGNVAYFVQLKDFSFLAQYSLTVTADEYLPPELKGRAELRIKMGMECESISAIRRIWERKA